MERGKIVELCIATEERIDEIMELERVGISPPWTHGQMLAEIYNDSSCVLLTIEDEAVTAFAVLRFMAEEAELLRIVTDEKWQRRGIASRLLRGAIETAEKNGARSVFLEVRESNFVARALYEKHGFLTVGKRRGYYTEPEEDAVIMSLEVKNADD